MIENLNPYPEYKDSGLPWLGQVPAHWEIRRGKSLFSESNLPVRDGDEIVTCFRDGQVTLRKNRRTSGFMTALYEAGYQGVRTGQLVIHAMDAFAGAIGISDSDGKCTPEYIVLDPLSNSAHPSYFSQLLRHAARQQFILVQCPAVRERAPRFRYPNFGCMWMPLPPASEQADIARFLAWATNRLDRAIGAKRRIIALLQEQKQAIIHHAVTRGLDPSVPLKDSGIPWLGEIPEHWEVVRLKSLVSHVTSGSRGWSNFAADSGVLFIRIGNLTRASLDLDFNSSVRLRLPVHVLGEAARSRVQPDDLLLSITAFIGSVAVVPPDMEEAYVSQHVACCRPRVGAANSSRVGYVLLSNVGQTHGQLSMYGGTKQGLSLDDVRNYLVLLPPRSEQDDLVECIGHSTAALNAGISNAKHEITLLREYRTRLIADVVTGKLDVREVAKGLPEEELQDQPDASAVYDAEEAEDDAETERIDTAED